MISKIFAGLAAAAMVVMAPVSAQTQQSAPVQAPGQSARFVTLKFPSGPSLEVPRSWRAISPEMDEAIKTSRDAMLDLSGFDNSGPQNTTLIALLSVPAETYGSIRLNKKPDTPDVYPSAVEVKAEELDALMPGIILQSLKNAPWKMVSYNGTTKTQVSGYPAFRTSYVRTGPGGDVDVEVFQVMTPGQTFTLTTSCRVKEKALLLPILQKARQSLTIKL